VAFEDLQLTLVRELSDVERMMQWLGERRNFLAVDVETTGLNSGRDHIRLCQFGDSTQGWALDYKDWRGICKEIIDKYDRPIVCHNLIYDSTMLKMDGIEIPQRLAHDTMIMTHLKNPAARMDLKGASAMYVDKRAKMGQSLLKQTFALQGWEWGTIPIEVPSYWLYSTLDTCLTSMLADVLYPEISATYGYAYNLELAGIHCLRDAACAGLLVDEDYRVRACAQLEAEIALLIPQIPVQNPGSDDQIRNYLLSLGAPLHLKTDSGAFSVDKEVLDWLEPHFPVAGLVREYRTKTRFLHNYLQKFGDLAANGVLRANTRPVGARTGRMSVTEPPLQQLPRGRVVRDAIVARPGYCFVMADFSGMEMRALASDAREERMLQTFNSGLDVHNETARAIYGEGFTKQQRTLCKNAGFAKIYGAGIAKFSVTAGVDIPTATQFLSDYNLLYPGVDRFLGEVAGAVRKRSYDAPDGMGYVRLIDGRRLPVEPDEAYKGVNYRIQGSCAVVTKEKIVELDAAGLGPYFRLAVHDELLYEVPLELAEQARSVVEAVMPDKKNFPGVVLEIDSDIVNRWGEHYRNDYPVYIPTEEASWLANPGS
jgi:DNA polymerase-1